MPGSSIHLVRATGMLKRINLDEMLISFADGGLAERKQVSADIIVCSIFSFFSFCLIRTKRSMKKYIMWTEIVICTFRTLHLRLPLVVSLI